MTKEKLQEGNIIQERIKRLQEMSKSLQEHAEMWNAEKIHKDDAKNIIHNAFKLEIEKCNQKFEKL